MPSSGEPVGETTTLYRPLGRAELELVAASGYRAWPPRLPDQPIFYPVTNEAYAIEVNRWNVQRFGEGFVARFEVLKSFMDEFEIHTVGASHHTEWWIPAERLEELNVAIVGEIEIIGHYSEA